MIEEEKDSEKLEDYQDIEELFRYKEKEVPQFEKK